MKSWIAMSVSRAVTSEGGLSGRRELHPDNPKMIKAAQTQI
jgi:hypothetical protein